MSSQDIAGLPEVIPVFPLHGVLLLPGGLLPLNIFEKRYLSMVEDAMRSDHMIGMVQPESPDDEDVLFQVGCAGRITEFQPTGDGRYLITLTGVCRFRVMDEIVSGRLYRQVRVDWKEYAKDLSPPAGNGIDREHLFDLVETYFGRHDMTCNRAQMADSPSERLVTCLAMICPFDPFEQQALLEARDGAERAARLMTLLEMSLSRPTCGCCSDKCH